ncbi:MAG: TlpA disulfide reductase family protein [Chitinophagaceae bacterium]
MRLLIVAFLCFLSLTPFAQKKPAADIYSLEQFQQRVLQENDTLYVVNFWATWCGPCIKEMPHFKVLSKEMKDKPVKFILMSLDAQAELQQLNSFLDKKKIDIETHLFAGGDPNVWINQLEPSWEGSIPATFLYQKGRKLSFKESYFSTKNDLESFIINHR